MKTAKGLIGLGWALLLIALFIAPISPVAAQTGQVGCPGDSCNVNCLSQSSCPEGNTVGECAGGGSGCSLCYCTLKSSSDGRCHCKGSHLSPN